MIGSLILVVVLVSGAFYLVRAYLATRSLAMQWRAMILGSLVLVELVAGTKLYDEVIGDASHARSLSTLLSLTIILAIWMMSPRTWERMAAWGQGGGPHA